MIGRLPAALVLAAAFCLGSPAAAAPLTDSQKKEFEQLIRDYLLQHPEILREMNEELQRRDQQDAEQALQAALKASRQELLASPSSPTGGAADGDVTLVEFFDYQSPAAKATEPHLAAALKADGRVRVVYKELPMLGPASLVAAKAALAARLQGKYEPFHRALLAAKGKLDNDSLLALAGDAGLDLARLKADMDRPEVAREIAANLALAERLAIKQTPWFLVSGAVVSGPVLLNETFLDLFRQGRSG
jgi:protein-disulfide isomerase